MLQSGKIARFITAVSGRDIRAASGPLQLFTKYSQYMVSYSVAVFIVDMLKQSRSSAITVNGLPCRCSV